MSFNDMLDKAEPRDAARAAHILARSCLADTQCSPLAREKSHKLLALTEDELTERIIAARAGDSP
jgi:hypothetical protein